MKRSPLFFLAIVMTLLFAFNCANVSAAFAATAPVITTQPNNVTVNAGAKASFSVVVSGTTPITYQWYQNGNPISGATSATYTIASTPEADNNSYFYVTATNSAGEAVSNYAGLTVDGKPVITEQPASVTVTEPSVVTFNVGVAGSGNLTYEWYMNGSLFPASYGCTWSSCTTGDLTVADTGAKVTVKITNNYGSVISTPAVVTVLAPTGTSPFVGNWSGTVKVLSVDQGTTTSKVDVSISQSATAFICTLVVTDSDGGANVIAGMLQVNGLNVFGVAPDGELATTYYGAFTANQLTLNLSAVDNTGAIGSGAATVSANHTTLTGTSTYTDPNDADLGASGTITWSLTRQ